jgi:glucosamine-6-phosphate deaminase
MPSLEDDALPMANLIRAKQPHVVTVAFDPEGTGPDTHYKVLQVVAAGLRICYTRRDLPHLDDLLIWGYRNVWFQFLPSYATLMIPVTKSDLELMHQTFMHCFTTQKEASFPSPYYDGPFSLWAKAIQEKQREELEILLGADYFSKHSNVLVQNAAGFIFIQAMYLGQFLEEVEELKNKFENITV